MKKGILLFYCLIYMCLSIFSMETILNDNGIAFSLGTGSSQLTGLKGSIFAEASASYTYKSNRLFLGYEFTPFIQNYSVILSVVPIQYGIGTIHLLAGARGVFHYADIKESGNETDFLAALSAGFATKNNFALRMDFGIHHQTTNIYGIKPSFNNMYYSFNIRLQKQFNFGLNVYGALSSYENFRYPAWLTPVFVLGSTYKITPAVSLGIQYIFRYTDIFTLTSYLDGHRCSIYISYRFAGENK